MAFFVGQPVVYGAPTDIHTEALNAVGTEAKDNLGNTYIYLKGVASVIAGSWVAYNESYETIGLDTDVAESVVSPVAVAQAAVVASRWGWFMRKGSCSANSGTVSDNAPVFATSTVFRCDDAAVANMQVVGAAWKSADSSNLATVFLNNPWVGVDEAA